MEVNDRLFDKVARYLFVAIIGALVFRFVGCGACPYEPGYWSAIVKTQRDESSPIIERKCTVLIHDCYVKEMEIDGRVWNNMMTEDSLKLSDKQAWTICQDKKTGERYFIQLEDWVGPNDTPYEVEEWP